MVTKSLSICLLVERAVQLVDRAGTKSVANVGAVEGNAYDRHIRAFGAAVILTGNGPSARDGGYSFCSGGDQQTATECGEPRRATADRDAEAR